MKRLLVVYDKSIEYRGRDSYLKAIKKEILEARRLTMQDIDFNNNDFGIIKKRIKMESKQEELLKTIDKLEVCVRNKLLLASGDNGVLEEMGYIVKDIDNQLMEIIKELQG